MEPRIEQVYWTLPIELNEIAFKQAKLKDLTWNLRTMHVGDLRISSIPDLARFPQLTRLQISQLIEHARIDAVAPLPPVEWPTSTRNLLELSIEHEGEADSTRLSNQQVVDVLSVGRFPMLEKLVLHMETTTIQRLTPLLESMPNLTTITLGCAALDPLEAQEAFKKVPHLKHLYELTWNFSPDADLSTVFPSLVHLSVSRGVYTLPVMALVALTSIPKLKTLKWRLLPLMTSGQIVEKCEEMERESQRLRQQQAAADVVERQERLSKAELHCVQAGARIDATVPKTEDLVQWYQGDYDAEEEPGDSVSKRLQQAAQSEQAKQDVQSTLADRPTRWPLMPLPFDPTVPVSSFVSVATASFLEPSSSPSIPFWDPNTLSLPSTDTREEAKATNGPFTFARMVNALTPEKTTKETKSSSATSSAAALAAFRGFVPPAAFAAVPVCSNDSSSDVSVSLSAWNPFTSLPAQTLAATSSTES